MVVKYKDRPLEFWDARSLTFIRDVVCNPPTFSCVVGTSLLHQRRSQYECYCYARDSHCLLSIEPTTCACTVVSQVPMGAWISRGKKGGGCSLGEAICTYNAYTLTTGSSKVWGGRLQGKSSQLVLSPAFVQCSGCIASSPGFPAYSEPPKKLGSLGMRLVVVPTAYAQGKSS